MFDYIKERVDYCGLITKPISYLIPKKKKRWIFGSWLGRNYSDNTKYLMEYIMEHNKDNIELVWIIDDINKVPINIREKVKVIKKGTYKSFWYILTSKVAFMTQGYCDFSPVNILGGKCIVQLWHGVGIKKCGQDGNQNMKIDNFLSFAKIKMLLKQVSIVTVPSIVQCNNLSTAFLIKEKEFYYVGQPRNCGFYDEDWLLNCKKKIIRQVNEKYNTTYSVSTKIISYLPTFREIENNEISFNDYANEQKLQKLLEKHKDTIIIEKRHFVDKKKFDQNMGVYNLVDVDTQELLASTDILISDYSSCIYDFMLLRRPCIHYIYDYYDFRDDDRGLYYSIEDAKVGMVAYTYNELIDVLEQILDDNYYFSEDEYNKKRTLFQGYEGPGSCELIYKKVAKYIKLEQKYE